MRQLEIYSALFCLEYGIQPENIGIELRIYQNDEVLIHEPKAPVIVGTMEKIIEFDARIEKMKTEV